MTATVVTTSRRADLRRSTIRPRQAGFAHDVMSIAGRALSLKLRYGLSRVAIGISRVGSENAILADCGGPHQNEDGKTVSRSPGPR